ncbi:MAG: hypothetical protein PWR20_587 [Bacteroidales bacterium]|nr:hypothetical protein [Bacteroidales bacterium]MDN5328869.1 hypothetical protein [Bacteroidales bacterium]
MIYNQTIEAEKWAREALTKAKKLQNAKRRAQALNLLGIGKDLVNQIDSAYYYYNLALNQARIAKNKLVLASSLNNLGMLQQKQGYYEEATPYFHEAASVAYFIKSGATYLEVNADGYYLLVGDSFKFYPFAGVNYFIQSITVMGFQLLLRKSGPI